jgi:hypothetical protein
VAPATDHPNEPQFEIYHDSLSRAVLAWRRRFVESQHRKRQARQIVAAALVLLVAIGAFGYFRAQSLEAQAAQAKATAAEAEVRAAQTRLLENEARRQLAIAEAEEAQHKLQDVLQQKSGDSRQVKQLQDEVKKRREEAAQYEKVARDLKEAATTQSVSKDAAQRQLDLVTKRASYAESERDQFRKQADLLAKEKEDLVRERDALRKSAEQKSPPATRFERWSCQLERIRIFEDGGTGDASWIFRLTIRTASGNPQQFTIPLVLNDGKPLMELGRNWAVQIDPTNPLALIEISAFNTEAKTSTTVNGYADGSRARAVTLIMDDPKKGTLVFEFSLQSGAKGK